MGRQLLMSLLLIHILRRSPRTFSLLLDRVPARPQKWKLQDYSRRNSLHSVPVPNTFLSSTTESSVETLPEAEDIDWRNHKELTQTVAFKSWTVKVDGDTSIQNILNSKVLQPFLASRHALVPELKQRPRIVRDGNDGKRLILILPDAPNIDELSEEAKLLLKDVQEGPLVHISYSYEDFSVSYILHKVLPESVHPVTTSFETIGHVAHLNLPRIHLPYRKVIGEVMLESLPLIETVIHKVGEVSGPFRTYQHELLAGHDSTWVELIESGIKMKFDLNQVYWCSRLSQERKRLLTKEFHPNQTIADPFCGAGALCILAASKLGCTVWANDWNPKAVEYLKENARDNNVKIERLSCGDAYDFMMDMGLGEGEEASTSRLPDHVVMNFPLKAPEFLGALRWWQVSDETVIPRVHVYTFARADDVRSAEDVAVDLVATNLLGRDVTCGRNELDDHYDSHVKVHFVRDVAPGKSVFCVSFSATSGLLKYMQGYF